MFEARNLAGQHVFIKLARSFFSLVTDFVYPPYCLLCNTRLKHADILVCPGCWYSIPHKDQSTVDANVLNLDPPVFINRSFAAYEYSESLQELIHLMKYRDLFRLAELLGKRLAIAGSDENVFAGVDAIVPVPLHPTRYRERGYNQAELLARNIASELGISMINPLSRVRYTDQQAKFNRNERLENVRDAFRIKKNQVLRGKRLALVDDVLTTGSTMNECAKQLHKAGAREILAVSIVRV